MNKRPLGMGHMMAHLAVFCLLGAALCLSVYAAPSPIGTGLFTSITLGALQDPSVVNRQWPAYVDYDIDLNSRLYDVYVPPSYDGTKPYGVVVYTTSDSVNGVVLQTASADKNLIWIAPRYVGNNVSDYTLRFGATLMAIYRAKELFNIDPRRVYTSGKSGGARIASALAFYHSEIIKGTAPSSGLGLPRLNAVTPDYITDNDGQGDTFFDYSNGWFFGENVSSINSTAVSRKLRSYILTRYDDYRDYDCVEAFHCAYEPQGQTCFLYLGPGSHQDASDAEMEEAINYLDRDDTFPVNANITSGTSGFANIVNISQAGATASGTTTGNGGNAVSSYTLTPTLNAVAAVKSGSSFYWDNSNGSTVRWLWEVKNAAPTNQKTCFGLWFANETWGGGAPVSVTSGTNPGILITITQNGSQNRMVISARPDSGGETIFYDGYFSFVPAYSTAWTSTQTGYLTGTGSPVEIRMDINQKRWQLTFNGINLNGATNSIANGTQLARDKTNDSDDKRLIFGYWDTALGTTFWKHGTYTSWNNTWSPFTKSIVTAATGAITPSGSTPSPMDLRYVIASDPGLPAPLPPGPDTVSATGTNGAIRLSWTASAGATSYNVKRSGTSGTGYSTLTTTTALNYIDTAVTNGTTYYYVVTAQTANGESVTGPEARATPDANSLIANLRFDESSGTAASDSTGHGWNGTLINGAGWSVGKINNAVSLTGASSQYVTLPTGIMSGVTDCTISAWVKATTLSTWMRVFDFGTGTSNYMFLAPKGGSTKVRFAILTPSTGTEQGIESSSTFPTGVWTHLAVTFSGSTGTLYMNGAVAGTNTAMTVNPSSLGLTNQNYIGKSQWSDPYLDGLIDHFQIFGRALNASEVAALAAPPTAPGGVIATGSTASATISWNAVTGATGYNVMRSPTSGSGYTTVAASVAGTSFVDTGLANSTTYYYVVTALNGVAESPSSVETSATTFSAPAITSSLSASATKNSAFNYQITATASPSSYGATGLPTGLGVNTSSGLISGVPTVTGSFNVTISATNVIGTGSATLGMIVVSDQFAPPAGVTASGSNGSVTLTWLSVPTAVSYKVKRSTTSGGPYTTLASGVTPLTYRDTTVTNWTPYYYVVTAVDGSAVESANSAEVSATPMPPTTWIGNGADSNWQTSSNWSSLPVAGDTLYFSGGTRLSNTNNYPANTAFGGMVFNSGAGGFALSGNAITLQGDIVNNATSTQTINHALILAGANRTINTASGNISIPGAISESGGSYRLVKTGGNTLTLGGASTFSGGVSHGAGTISVTSSSALGTGTLALSGGILNNSGAGSTPTVGNAIAISGSTSAIQVTTSQNFQFNGAWSGAGAVTLGNGGNNISLYLNGTNSMTSGTITLANNTNSVRIQNPSFGNAGLVWVFNNTVANRETLDFTTATISFGSMVGAGIVQGNNGTGTKTISAGALGYNDTFSGTIQDGGGSIALIKTGAGIFTLSGANSYSAGTTINAGTLNLTGTFSGGGGVTVNNGGILAGTGTAAGTTTVASGGIIAPGNAGTGTLRLAALALNGGAILNMELSGTGNSDKIAVAGNLSASGTTTVNLSSVTGFSGAGTYPLISGTAAINAANFTIGSKPVGYGFALTASSGTLSVIVGNPPSTPTGLTATAANGSVALRWTPSSGANSYTLKRSGSSGGGYASISLGISGTSATDATVSNGTTYFYVVSAVNSAGESANSNQVSATPDGTPPVVTVPSNITATATGPNGAVVTFSTSAVDAISGACATTNVPASGSVFPIGTTTVTATAADSVGNIGSATFTISVQTLPISSAEQQSSSSLSVSGSSGTLTVQSSVPGHTYQLQYCDDLTSGSWQNYGAAQIGDSTNLQFAVPVDAAKSRRFYRIQIEK